MLFWFLSFRCSYWLQYLELFPSSSYPLCNQSCVIERFQIKVQTQDCQQRILKWRKLKSNKKNKVIPFNFGLKIVIIQWFFFHSNTNYFTQLLMTCSWQKSEIFLLSTCQLLDLLCILLKFYEETHFLFEPISSIISPAFSYIRFGYQYFKI